MPTHHHRTSVPSDNRQEPQASNGARQSTPLTLAALRAMPDTELDAHIDACLAAPYQEHDQRRWDVLLQERARRDADRRGALGDALTKRAEYFNRFLVALAHLSFLAAVVALLITIGDPPWLIGLVVVVLAVYIIRDFTARIARVAPIPPEMQEPIEEGLWSRVKSRLPKRTKPTQPVLPPRQDPNHEGDRPADGTP